jgi:transcriptional regulator with GAF, ATPase, and Fis domain
MVAKAIHNNSPRRENRIAVLSCHQKPHDLVEAELFGHVRGTFTGAYETRTGLFEYADGGTIFLDEIGDLDITTQANLLRVLECGEYCKVGSPEIRKTDVRVLCATHKNLAQLVKEGKFREDLYFRLKGIIITLPPLRERREDIPLLVEKFKDQLTIEKGLPPKIFEQQSINFMISYDWPGNVRQLQDTVESSIILADSDIIFLEDVLATFDEPCENNGYSNNDHKSLAERVFDFRGNCIIEALHETQNNVTHAARLLKMDRANLRKLIDRHKINLGK